MTDWSPLAEATRVLIVRQGSSFDEILNEQPTERRSRASDGSCVLRDERDPRAVRSIVEILSNTVLDAPGMDWMEPHQLLFVLMDGDRVIRVIGVLGGAGWTRDVEFGDLPIVDPPALDA